MFPQELSYMLAIRETGNITRAAEKLNVAQPSLSQKIQRMETELGCQLLMRLPSGVQLTQAGEHYCAMAEQTLLLYQAFLSQIGALQTLSRGKLRIGASWYISTTFLPRVLSQYQTLYPNIQLDLQENRSSILLESLRSGTLDVAFVSHFPDTADGGDRLHYEPLFRDPFCLIAPRSWTIHEKTDVLQQIKEKSLIMFRENQRIRQITDQILTAAGIIPQIKMTTYGFPIAVEQVAAGHGAAILPKGYVESLGTRYPIRAYELEEAYHAFWNIGICYYRAAILPGAVSAFLDLLKHPTA